MPVPTPVRTTFNCHYSFAQIKPQSDFLWPKVKYSSLGHLPAWKRRGLQILKEGTANFKGGPPMHTPHSMDNALWE
jgi:hypothetical protein